MIEGATVQHISDTSKEFEWDRNKGRRNLQKHGVSFEHACSAFDDAYAMITYDTLHSDTEDRYQLLGMANGACSFWSYLWKGMLCVLSPHGRPTKRK